MFVSRDFHGSLGTGNPYCAYAWVRASRLDDCGSYYSKLSIQMKTNLDGENQTNLFLVGSITNQEQSTSGKS